MITDVEWALLQQKMRFTDRELEVLRGVFGEQTDKAIAIALGITSRTVRAHLESVYRKCRCRTRTGAVVSVFHTLRRGDVRH